MTRVLVVDDDPNILRLVRLYLEREGVDVLEARDGEEALAVFESSAPDLVVMDVMMPNMDGWELLETLRTTCEQPVLMLTAKGQTPEKVRGLSLGADDYLVKPFDPPELIARVKALLRRYRIATSNTVRIGAVELDGGSFQATGPDGRLTLPRKEFELLFFLASYAGRTLTREHLIEKLWGYDYEGDERTVDVHVKRLRDRFGDGCGFRIVTIRGLGYRLEEVP